MTPTQFREARHTLGLSCAALARALRVSGFRTVQRYETGERPVPGPVAVAVEAMLAHGLPPWKRD